MSKINQQKLFDEIAEVLKSRDQPEKETATIAILDIFSGAAELDTAENRVGLSTRNIRRLLVKLKNLQITRETISRIITDLIDDAELEFIGYQSAINVTGRTYKVPIYSRVR